MSDALPTTSCRPPPTVDTTAIVMLMRPLRHRAYSVGRLYIPCRDLILINTDYRFRPFRGIAIRHVMATKVVKAVEDL